MSLYLLSGKDIYRQEEKLKSILKDLSVDAEHIVMIDGSNKKAFRMEEVMMACDTMSLFDGSDRKAVIVKEPFFLNAAVKDSETSTKKADPKKERRISILESYLKNPNPLVGLIFYCHNFDADSRKKEYKLLQTYNATIVKFDKMKAWDFEKYTDEQLKKNGFSLNREARSELLLRVDNDTLLLHNAIEKLSLYGEQKYDRYDIQNLVPASPEVNVFQLTNAFVAGNLSAEMQAIAEMKADGIDYTGMIPLLANRLRSFYNVKKLYELGLSDQEIAVRTRTKEYAVKKNIENCRRLNSARLLKMLAELADLDQNIKTGKIQPKDGFEDFILRNGTDHAGN